MKNARKKQSIVALAVVVLVALPLPAAAQYDDASRAKRAKEFGELFAQLQVTTLLLSLQSSLESQRDDVDDQGNMLNPVVTAKPNDIGRSSMGSHPMFGEPESKPSPDAHGCINPPSEKRARYVAAYVNIAPRIDSMGRRSGGAKLHEDKLAPELADRLMPEKIREGQPGVLILINRGDGDWAYALDDMWPKPELARQWLDAELEGRVDEDNAVCQVARAVEQLLREAEDSSISEVLQRRRLSARLEETKSRLAEVRADAQREVADTDLYRSAIQPDYEQAGQQLDIAQQKLVNRDLDAASSAIEAAQKHIDDGRTTYGVMTSMQSEARKTRSALERLRANSEFRRTSFLPFGEEMIAKYETCKGLLARFSDAAHAGASTEKMYDTRGPALECIDEFRARRQETQGTFDLYVVHIPIGAFGVIILLGLVGVSVRTKKRQTLKYEVSPELSEWAQFVPMFDRRLQRLKRKYPHILGADEHAAMSAGLSREQIDTIDRSFAMAHRAGEILDQANRLERESSLFNISALEDCRALLVGESSELTTSNTSDVTPIRHGISDTETVPHRELLQATDRLTQRAESILAQLEDEDDTDGTW